MGRGLYRIPETPITENHGVALTEGIETHRLEGATVRIYSAAKTVADCFEYRNKVGLDVALEALREAWRDRRFTMDRMHRYARICRVEQVMRHISSCWWRDGNGRRPFDWPAANLAIGRTSNFQLADV